MGKNNYRVLLSEKEYLKLLAADLVSRFGDSLDAIAYSWIMYEVTGSESLMALIIGLNYIPTVLLQPFCGALVDRLKKKKLMVLTDVLRFLVVAVLAFLYVNGKLTSLIIALLTLVTSTIEAFRMPAGNAAMPMILKPDHYTIGKAANYSLSRGCELVGYILAGSLIAIIGSANVLLIDAATFAISAFLISRIRMDEKKRRREICPAYILRDFREGITFVKGNQTMQAICLVGIVINFGLMPLSVFQTPYVTDYLKMGPTILSYIKILMIAGMMAGAAVAPKITGISKAKLDTVSGIGMGIAIILMFVTPYAGNIVLLMILLTLSMFFVGVGGGILNVVIGGCMMKIVPEEMMGRISGLNSAIMGASMPIGSFLCSALVLKLSVTQLFLLFGACTVVFYIYMGASHRLDGLDV